MEVDVPGKLPAVDPVVETSCLDSESSDDDKCAITVPVFVSNELSTQYEKSVYCLLDRSSDPIFFFRCVYRHRRFVGVQCCS